VAGYAVAWLVIAVALAAAFFFSSSAMVTVASHDAVIRPSLDGYVTVHTGPFLPDVRRSTGSTLGVDVVLGKTEASSTEELVSRYAFIASQPDAQVGRVEDAVLDMVSDAALRGAVTALVPIGAWLLVGRRRRREIWHLLWERKVLSAAVTTTAVAVGVLVWQPWDRSEPMLSDGTSWQPLQDYVPEINVPAEAADLQVGSGLTTTASKRLVLSAIDTYAKSREFYDRAEESARTLELRQPAEEETVAVLVSDRHDNIGMDPVIRAIADQGGATAILDAGDDTSTGSTWEAFSLDSLHDAFGDFEQRHAVAGNHDHGGFVSSYLADRGWTTAREEPVEGPGGSVLLAADDPRSSGLGTWRDERGLTVPELGRRIADTACDAEERVNTLLVHDSDMGTAALQRGCVDLVVSGHLHVRVGPTRVEGADGVGYAYTNGTSGGAAYAIAVGSKLRRAAEVTLVTYRDGRPVGLQGVLLQTNGVFVVDEYVPLALEPIEEEALGPAGPGAAVGQGQGRPGMPAGPDDPPAATP
jgi:hypothetical protein